MGKLTIKPNYKFKTLWIVHIFRPLESAFQSTDQLQTAVSWFLPLASFQVWFFIKALWAFKKDKKKKGAETEEKLQQSKG